MAVTVIVALPGATGRGVSAGTVAEETRASAPSIIAVRILAFMILLLPFFASLWLDAARAFRVIRISCTHFTSPELPIGLSNMKPRSTEKASAREANFDLCVIGGGATGAGCALDAQLRGLKTVLLEGADFAAAASSASTKLAHGGVRYLEQAVKKLDIAEYRMVQRALRERLYMLRNAPHLAHAVKFLLPVFSWSQAFYYRTGMKLYDWLS